MNNVSFISYSAITIALIEFAQTKPLKIHGMSGFDLRFTVGSGKCVLDMKMVGTRETDGIFGFLTSKSSIFAEITF